MKAINEMKLQFMSRSTNESFARSAVAAFFVQLDPTVEEITDIKTAVSEAVTNCIVHAYRNTAGKIMVHAKIFENNRIYIKIKDNGCGIEDIKQAVEPMFTTDDSGERSGLGFVVMQTFMDKLKIFSKPGRGTTVVMHKTLLQEDEG